MTKLRMVDDDLDVVVYECASYEREVGSPMPRALRCLGCGQPMSALEVRGERGWRPWSVPTRNPTEPETLFPLEAS